MIARTNCTISHPLMSPTGTDSDSHYNFPDVVPAKEHLTQQELIHKGPQIAQHNTISVLRTHIDEISQYHAAVEANMHSVTLTTNNIARSNKSDRPKRTCKTDDISSLDSISNHSFDDDEDIGHLASLSPTSSVADGLDDDDKIDDDAAAAAGDHGDNECDDEQGADIFVARSLNHNFNAEIELKNQMVSDLAEVQPTTASVIAGTLSNVLPQYSAVEERRNSRNWQKITLPDGRIFEIDMRVIEPYKRVLSHGGYLKAGGHNAIVIFCACHLPDRSRADYSYVMDNLFLYVVKTLEQLVTDDYVLIYLHGGCNRRNVPPFPWLKKCYQLLDRRLRKSLKNMYLVHPTFWIKSIVWMARPFVSVKFWRKLVYVKSLEELGKHVSVEKAAIPEKVKQYDAKHT